MSIKTFEAVKNEEDLHNLVLANILRMENFTEEIIIKLVDFCSTDSELCEKGLIEKHVRQAIDDCIYADRIICWGGRYYTKTCCGCYPKEYYQARKRTLGYA